MCKSGPLFSPVRESPLCSAGPNYSVDSLDCEEQDILLTCQANKDNYTIAFEGSTLMGDDSDCHHTGLLQALSQHLTPHLFIIDMSYSVKLRD